MNNSIKKIVFILLIVGYVISIPIYGKASNLKRHGNIKGFEEEIKNMKEDFIYLESELISLRRECD